MTDFSNLPPLPPSPAYLDTTSSTGGVTPSQGISSDTAIIAWVMSMHNAIIPRYQKLEEDHIKIKEQINTECKILNNFRLLVFLCYCLFLFSSAAFIIVGIFVYLIFVDGSSTDKIDQVFSIYKYIGYGTFLPIAGAAILLWGMKRRIDEIEKKISR